LYDQKDVNTKYISMKMEPKGRMPDIGMMKAGATNHGADGIGLLTETQVHTYILSKRILKTHDLICYCRYLGMLLTRQGGSALSTKWRPNMVPMMVRGKDTNSHTAIIFSITGRGMALTVSYETEMQFRAPVTVTIIIGKNKAVQIIAFCHSEFCSALAEAKYFLNTTTKDLTTCPWQTPIIS
jgi:hypothetical protein